jgi:hypothetical protein
MSTKEKCPTYFRESAQTLVGLPKSSQALSVFRESTGESYPKVIYPSIRILTASKKTRNKTFYPKASLVGDPEEGTGLISFIRPYPVPVIRDHNTGGMSLFGSSESSPVYGRVFDQPDFCRRHGVGFLRAFPAISSPEAIENILTGRWMTVSLGSNVESVKCSICKKELTKEMCDHSRGVKYEVDGEEQEAYWVMGPIRAREVSFVLSPSDDEAGVLEPNVSEEEGWTTSLSHIFVPTREGFLDLATGKPVAVPLPIRLEEERQLLIPTPMLKTKPEVTKESYNGPGHYKLTGHGHEHDVDLDKAGNGTSSYSGDPEHTHEVIKGESQPGGKDDHTHDVDEVEESENTPASLEDDDGGEKDDEPCTLGDLYCLPADHPDYHKKDEEAEEAVLTTKTRKALPDSAFCGPNRSFPAHDKAHVRAGLTFLGRAKLTAEQKSRVRACLMRKGKSMGMAMGDRQSESILDLLVGALEQQDYGYREKDDDRVCTLGELYSLPADHPDYDKPDGEEQSEATLTTKTRKSLPDSAFCGPNRTFPAHDKAHVRNGLARLPQAKGLSPATRAKIHGCLASRAKRYGIKVGDRQSDMTHLVRLLDPRCMVEFDLYPIPSNEQDLASLVKAIESMPHTEDERTEIYARLSHCAREGIAEEVWKECGFDQFYDEADLTVHEPFVIELNAENYPLAYLAARSQIARLDTTLEGEEGAPSKPKASGSVSLPEKSVPSPEKARIEALEAEIAAREETAKSAVAATVALYLRSMRRPLARNRSHTELLELLGERSLSSLTDMLSDLLHEVQTSGCENLLITPSVSDPTLHSETEATQDDGGSGTEEAESQTQTRITPVEELDEEDADVVFLVFPGLGST